jgi:hypothetical protein
LIHELGMLHDKQMSRIGYNFNEGWKDADPDIPIYKTSQSRVREVAVGLLRICADKVCKSRFVRVTGQIANSTQDCRQPLVISGKVCQLHPMPRMGNGIAAPNVCSIGVRHIKRQTNCFDCELRKARQDLASIGFLVQPPGKLRRIRRVSFEPTATAKRACRRCQRRLLLCMMFRRAVLSGPTGKNSVSWNVAIIQLQSGHVTYTTRFPFLSVRFAEYATTFLQLVQYARSGSLIALAPQGIVFSRSQAAVASIHS